MNKIKALTIFTIVVGLTSSNASAGTPKSLGVELGYHSNNQGNNSLNIISPLITAKAPVGEILTLEAIWGLTYAETSGTLDDNSGFKSLNPYLSVHVNPDLGPIKLRVGLGITAPVANVSNPNEAIAYSAASGIRGAWNDWLYSPDTFALTLPFRAVLDLPSLELMGEGALFSLISTDEDADPFGGFQLAAQAKMYLGLAGNKLGYGLRLQTVQIQGFEEEFQVSIEPLLSLNISIVELNARFTMNLNEPHGFAFDDDGFWGLHVGASLNW